YIRVGQKNVERKSPTFVWQPDSLEVFAAHPSHVTVFAHHFDLALLIVGLSKTLLDRVCLVKFLEPKPLEIDGVEKNANGLRVNIVYDLRNILVSLFCYPGVDASQCYRISKFHTG